MNNPPQHHRKRGYRKTLASVLRHVEAACGYDDASWLYYHIAALRQQANLHRKDNELMLRVLAKERQKVCDLRDKLAAWDAWEHAWVFGGDAEYPGKAGVTDPRETLDALERLALGGWELVGREEADDA